jgi:cell wall-associated NlpC family hydrolase
VRVRALSSMIFCSLMILSIVTTPALATKTGGVAAVAPAPRASNPAVSGGSTPTAPPKRPKPAKLLHTAPVTALTPALTYTGPVYEKTVTGQIVPYVPPVPAGQAGGTTGGSPVGMTADTKPELLVPGSTARYVDGLAAAPMSVPAPVQEIIWAGNELIGLPYIFGGGHASFVSPGYDCSGTVSFALHGASLLSTPEDSSEFEVWGSHGVGRWVSIFSNPGHAYMTVAGLRLDTSAADDPSNQQGPRWRPLRQANEGFKVRHPLGL